MNLPTDYTKLTRTERSDVRERYEAAQGGICSYCAVYLDEDPPDWVTGFYVQWDLFPGGRGFLNNPIHLHHDHATGMTEGAVHAYCNAVMWQYEGR